MATISATAVFVAAGPPRSPAKQKACHPRKNAGHAQHVKLLTDNETLLRTGLPRLRVAKAARLRCSCSKDLKNKVSSALAMAVVKGAPLLAEASAMAVAAAPVLAPALVLALVDERVSTDGTVLSHDLLGWILMVAFGLALSYTVYSSIFKDDNDDDQSSAGGITI